MGVCVPKGVCLMECVQWGCLMGVCVPKGVCLVFGQCKPSPPPFSALSL